MKIIDIEDVLNPKLTTVASLDRDLFKSHAVKKAIPTEWVEQAKKAWEYYLQEPIVSNTINSWRVFALGDEIKITCEDEYIENEALKLFKDHNINRFVNDMILQLLVKGDAIGYLNRSADGRDIGKVTCVNPISVKLSFDNGVLVKAVQSNKTGQQLYSDDEIEFALDQMIHLKWNSPEYAPRGNSMILPAFESIELLRDYRKAERAIAKRWTTPLRFIQVGGQYGNKTVIPDNAMIENIKNELNNMDLEAGLVVPFYVKAETYEGKTLETESKVKEIKQDILIAMGMARSVVAGDGPNFATASISMQKMVVQLKEIKQAARQVLNWIFDEWKELKGFKDIELDYHFNDLDLHNELDIKKIFLEMYDRGLISKKTFQTKMGLNHSAEKAGKESEEVVINSNWSIQDITHLVALNIISPEQAREKLGIESDESLENEPEPESKTVDAMYKKLERTK